MAMSNPKKKGKKGKPFRDDNKDRGTRRERNNHKSSDREDKNYNKRSENEGFSNDPNWWMKAGKYSVDTSTFSTYFALGAPGPGVSTDPNFTPAGIARFDYMPCFGHIDSVVHPINTAAKLMYDLINSKNSRNTAYDPSDLMVYVLAVANAWALHSWVLRVVGMFNTFSVTNRYWWTPMARSMGIAANSTANDIVAWRNLANRMALKLNMLSVPNAIAYYAREVFMPSGVYSDSPTSKASLFYFSPATLLRYQYDDNANGMLASVRTPFYTGDNRTPAQIEEFFDTLTANLFNDSDVNLMGSDIIKAYGMENCFRLPQVSEDYSMTYIYDPTVNLQLHNAVVWNNLIDPATSGGANVDYQVTQDMSQNCLVANCIVEYPATAPVNGKITALRINHNIPLDFPTDDPKNEDFVEATRLTSFIDESGKLQCCTEVLVRDSYWTFMQTGSSSQSWSLVNIYGGANLGLSEFTADSSKSLLRKVELYSKFHDAPLQLISIPNGKSYYPPAASYFTSDVTNLTGLAPKELKAMNEACLISVFSPIPLG